MQIYRHWTCRPRPRPARLAAAMAFSTAPAGILLLALFSFAYAQNQVNTVLHTVQDSSTGFKEAVLAATDSARDLVEGAEFDPFANTYTIDVATNEVLIEVTDDSLLRGGVVIPEGEYDRFYFGFDVPVSDVSVVLPDGEELDATARLVDPGPLAYVDLYEMGLPLDISLPHTGIALRLGPGTNLSLGFQVRVAFKIAQDDTLAAPGPSLDVLDYWARSMELTSTLSVSTVCTAEYVTILLSGTGLGGYLGFGIAGTPCYSAQQT